MTRVIQITLDSGRGYFIHPAWWMVVSALLDDGRLHGGRRPVPRHVHERSPGRA
jgi:hypothetical protein